MNANLPVLRFIFSFSSFHLVMLGSISIGLLCSLSSCDPGSTGQHKSESMHWLQFRGPDASGIAPSDADPPIHFSADTNLFWRTEMLPGWSSPCIVNDKIFLTGFNHSDSLLYTVAINREDGEIQWKNSVMPHEYYALHPVNSYASPTVASDGKQIYVRFMNYGLIAYDVNGGKSWEFQHDVIDADQGGGSSPVVLDTIVISKTRSGDKFMVSALSSQTGDIIWQQVLPNSSATPVIWNDKIILHGWREIRALNIVNGQQVWWLYTPTKAIGTPVIKDGVLFVNTWTNFGDQGARDSQPSFEDLVRNYDKNSNRKIERDEFPDDMFLFDRPGSSELPEISRTIKEDFTWQFGFDSNEDGSFDEGEWNEMWEYAYSHYGIHGMLALPLEGSGPRPATDIKWKINEDSPEVPSPLIVGENVLFIHNGGKLTVIHQETGEVIHKDRIGAAGSYISSPMLAGNRIYLCSYNGTVTVLSADDFSILAHNKLKEKIGASPAAVDNVLYIRTDKNLYAFRDH